MDSKKKMYLEECNKCTAPSFTRQQPNLPIILNEITNLSFRGVTTSCKLIMWLCVPVPAYQLLNDPVAYYIFLPKDPSKS